MVRKERVALGLQMGLICGAIKADVESAGDLDCKLTTCCSC